MKRIRLRNDIRVRSDNSMDVKTFLIIPIRLQDIGGEVGVIFGNDGNDEMPGPKLTFSVVQTGQMRLKLRSNTTDMEVDGETGILHFYSYLV